MNCGIKVDDELVSIFLYADDIALVAPDENSLQRMLDCLYNWCSEWKLLVNPEKSQVIHFRWGPSVSRSNFAFKCGENDLQTVDRYRYLGLIFTEFLDLNVMSKAVALAATRALGLLIAKCKANGGVPFSVFTQLYDSLVQSIVDYGASVWGMNMFSHIRAIQFRAGRYFLGVGRYTPNNAIIGEMGWSNPSERLWKCVYRQWFRIARLTPDRLNARVHAWALRLALTGTKNSHHKVIQFSQDIEVWDMSSQTLLDRRTVLMKLNAFFVHNWNEEINREEGVRGVGHNKLRTYKLLKREFGTSPYVKDHHLTRAQRSALAKFRCGVAPLRLETGRFEGLPVEERLCPLCMLEPETEVHCFIKCHAFDAHRTNVFNAATVINNDFIIMSDVDKFVFIVTHTDMVKTAGKFCLLLLKLRREFVYSL